MNQAQRILKSNAPIQTVGDTQYKGQPPLYQIDQYGNTRKVSKGIPFVRIKA
jgi:hypothetical protein